MKRLLLSTTLILGTLTWANASAATHPAIGTLLTEIDQRYERSIDGQPTQTASAVNPLSAEVDALRRDVTALTTALIPAASSLAVDIDAELRGALDHPTNLRRQTMVLNNLDQALKTLGIDPSLVNSRRQNIESVVRAYFDNMIDYSPSSLANVFTTNTLGFSIMLAIVYEYLSQTEPKDRVAIAAPMGGGSTLATSTILIAGAYSLIRDHVLFWIYNYFNLSTHVAKLWTGLNSFFSLLFEHDNYYLYALNQNWGRTLSNPDTKTYLTKVLSAGWVLKGKPDSPKVIRTTLRDALLKSHQLDEIPNQIFELYSR